MPIFSRIPINPTDPWPGPGVRVVQCCDSMKAHMAGDKSAQSLTIQLAPRAEPVLPYSQAAGKRADRASHYTEPRSTAWQFGLYLTYPVEEPVMGGMMAQAEAVGLPIEFCPWCSAPIILESYNPAALREQALQALRSRGKMPS